MDEGCWTQEDAERLHNIKMNPVCFSLSRVLLVGNAYYLRPPLENIISLERRAAINFARE